MTRSDFTGPFTRTYSSCFKIQQFYVLPTHSDYFPIQH